MLTRPQVSRSHLLPNVTALGLGAVALVGIGPGRVLGFWTGALVAVVLLGAAALVLPFGLAVTWGRR